MPFDGTSTDEDIDVPRPMWLRISDQFPQIRRQRSICHGEAPSRKAVGD